MRVWAVLSTGVLLLSFSHAAANETKTLADSAKSQSATIAQAAWLAGRWVGEGLGGTVEEMYSPPVQGVIAGHFVSADDKGIGFFEFVEIKEEGDSLVYNVKHFNPDFVGWEEKDKYHTFQLVSYDANHLYFDGLTIFHPDADTAIHYVRVSSKGGKEQEIKFVYHRAGLDGVR